jgi:hypothetical protein
MIQSADSRRGDPHPLFLGNPTCLPEVVAAAWRQKRPFTAIFRATSQSRFIDPKIIIFQTLWLNSVATFVAYFCILYIHRD